MALIAASLQCAVIALVLTPFFGTCAKHPLSASSLKGALAAAIAIMTGTVWTMIRPSITRTRSLRTLLVAAAAFCFAYVFEITPIQVLLAAAMVGAVWTEPGPLA